MTEHESDDVDSVNGDVVDISVPASGAYVATLRLTASSLAARCDLTVDDIDDLSLAVDEACALLLPHAARDSVLSARFTLQSSCIEVATSVHAPDASEASPDRSGFAWSLLSALSSEVAVDGAGDRLSITVTKRREIAPA